jgi:hypothetical protein
MVHISDLIQATGLFLFVVLVGIGGNLAPHMHYKRTGEKKLFPWADLNAKEWLIALTFFGAGATFAFLGLTAPGRKQTLAPGHVCELDSILRRLRADATMRPPEQEAADQHE